MKGALIWMALLLPIGVLAQDIRGTAATKQVGGADRLYFREGTSFPRYLHYADALEWDERKARNYLSEVPGFSDEHRLEKVQELTGPLHDKHFRYRVLYRDAEIDGADITFHTQHGKLTAISGFIPVIESTEQAEISPEQAITMAISAREGHYAWESEWEEQQLKIMMDDSTASYYPKAELVWFPSNGNSSSGWVLCYRLRIFSLEPLFHEQVYLNATDGSLVYSENLIHDINVFGTAVTRFSGTRQIRTDSMSNGLYRLRDSSLGAKIITLDLNRTTQYANGVDFIDSNNYWNNVDTNFDEVATDAHWGAEVTYHYFKDYFGRNSYDNQNAAIYSYVHYGNKYNNAFWNGYSMTYGDGNGTSYNPFTALDVCGHEIGHAVTTYTANLIYQNESGALNESFSDIFGNSIEALYRTPHTWKIGEDLTVSGNGLRNMQNPKTHGDPRTYMGQYWYSGSGDNGGVHTNSGVQNYWYYLLCQGGSGINDNNDTFQVDSLGMLKAQQIAYRSLSVYLSRFSDYTDARYFSLIAVADLYGTCSPEVITTTNAWYAAGVGDEFDSTFVEAAFQSGDFFCFAPQQVAFINTSVNADSFVWDFGDGQTDTATHPVHTYNGYGFFNVTLQAYNCFGFGADTLLRLDHLLIDSTADICHALLMPDTGTQVVEFCKGFIYDAGGEYVYPDLSEQFLVIHTPAADSIALRFEEFGYENNYDYLYLYEGAGTGGTLVGKYTGASKPNSGNLFYVPGNTLTLRHSSDPAVVDIGFKLYYEGIRQGVSIQAPPDTLACRGDSLLLSVSPVGPDTTSLVVYWIDSLSGAVLSQGPDILLAPLQDTRYGVVVLDACNLQTDTAWFGIVLRDSLSLDLTSDTTICHLQQLNLAPVASGGLASGHQVNWPELGLSGLTVNASFASDTLIHAVLQDGCTLLSDTASISIKIRAPLSLQLTGDSVICPGDPSAVSAGVSGGDSTTYEMYWQGTRTDSLVYHNPAGFLGWVRAELRDGCSLLPATDSLFVRSVPSIQYVKPADTLMCLGQSVSLGLSVRAADFASLTVQWDSHPLQDSTVSVQPVVTGYYPFSIADRCMTVRDSVQVSLRPELKLNPMADTLICDGENLSRHLHAQGGDSLNYTFLWDDGYIGSSRSWAPLSSTQYQVKVEDGCSLPDSIVFGVVLRAPLSVSLGTDTSQKCPANALTFTAQAGGGFSPQYRYAWMNNVPGVVNKMTYGADHNGWIRVELSDGCSQSVRDSFFLNIELPEISTIQVNDTLLCLGGATTLKVSGTFDSVLWKFSDGNTIPGPNVFLAFPTLGTHSLTLQAKSAEGCTFDSITDIRIHVVPRAVASLIIDDKSIELGEESLLAVSGQTNVTDWLWEISDGSTYTGSTLNHTFTDTGQYIVRLQVRDVADCTDETYDTVTVFVPGEVWLPNCFTINKDDLHETWSPVTTGMDRYSLKIYDRWGSLVFECNSGEGCVWDGTDQKGRALPSGLYLVTFRGFSRQGERLEARETVMLMR